ncbi:hypothetical protein ABXS75_15415 [Roseburia hominis]
MAEAIELVRPKESLEQEIMDFRAAFLGVGEKTINGSRGLHHFESYQEWLQRVKECERPDNELLGVQTTLDWKFQR